MVKFLRIKLKTSLSSLEDGVSKTEVAHPKSFSHRQAVSVCNDGSVLTKLTGNFWTLTKIVRRPVATSPKESYQPQVVRHHLYETRECKISLASQFQLTKLPCVGHLWKLYVAEMSQFIQKFSSRDQIRTDWDTGYTKHVRQGMLLVII